MPIVSLASVVTFFVTGDQIEAFVQCALQCLSFGRVDGVTDESPRGGVDVHDVIIYIQHDHAIVHVLDQHVARHRHEFEQLVSKEGKGVNDAGECCGEGVISKPRTGLKPMASASPPIKRWQR